MGSGVQRGSNVTSTATSSTSGNRARRRWTPSTIMPPAGQPGVAIRNVLALLQASLRRAHLRVEDLSIFGVRQRIARFLIRLADWTGRQERGRTVVPLALSRQELAALVGTTMETTIRVMSGLRQQGLVEPARRGVVLTDRAALETVAAGAP